MANKIQVVIATNNDVYDYIKSTGAGSLQSGTTLASYISKLMQRAGDLIVQFINYDYTINQVFHWRSKGNDTNKLRMDHPVGGITLFKSWNPYDVTATVVDIGAPALGIVSIDPFQLYRTDSKLFDSSLMYLIEYTQAQSDDTVDGWPQEIKQVQVEMVANWYKQSWNLQGSQDWKSEPDVDRGQRISLLNMQDEYKKRLQPYRRYAV